ncbi:MAG: four helix bundle protein [Verrucomicrobiota bacterium]|jgi:four helix bundle protein
MNSYQIEKGAAPKALAVMFDHEKLDVYQFELRFIAWVTPLLEEAAASAKGKTREVCDQLDRASLSSLLNTAEGNGKRQRPVRAKFFDDARGSATECAACLDALVAKRVATSERIQEGKQMLLRIVSMLCGLIDRFDSPAVLREESCGCQSAEMPAVKVSYSSRSSRARTRTRTKRKI